jgi:hypothetical protein
MLRSAAGRSDRRYCHRHYNRAVGADNDIAVNKPADNSHKHLSVADCPDYLRNSDRRRRDVWPKTKTITSYLTSDRSNSFNAIFFFQSS